LATSSPTNEVIDRLLADLNRARARTRPAGRPFVTLAYAQSIDGSIALEAGRPFSLSGPESLRLTHALRAAHDGILVGIGTVLSDDPQLTVRLVEGRNPQPIVVDSRLRTPPTARLLSYQRATWIAATGDADDRRRGHLEGSGARVLRVPSWANGWVNLPALLERLAAQGLRHVMVEGGAKIITSFMRARLVDYAIVTVAPRFLGGMPAVSASERGGLPRLQAWATDRVGDDLVLSGEPLWAAE
jgi:3,4-dihydroxy 2-butanone 4-phosphate synthase/GTP cyclohydrolase II